MAKRKSPIPDLDYRINSCVLDLRLIIKPITISFLFEQWKNFSLVGKENFNVDPLMIEGRKKSPTRI